jgi:GT2 family glycosyltransferase
MPGIYTIIVTYNAETLIERCIASIHASAVRSEIVVVDNCSADRTVEIIREKFPDVTLICSDKNAGFGAANNIGMAHALKAGADYFFLLNQDAFLERDTLGLLLDVCGKFPGYGILSPVHLDGKNTAIDPAFAAHYITPSNCPGFVSDAYLGKLQKVYECRFVNAAAWLITKACIDAVGGFNPSFFMYGEDNDYCNRVMYHGFRIGICPEAKITHLRDHRGSPDSIAVRRRRIQRKFFNGYKIALTSPERSFGKVLAEMTMNTSKRILKNMITFRLTEAFLYSESLFQLLFRMNRIYATKKTSLKRHRAFLGE